MGNVDGFRHEREWDADLKVSQITLKPVYFYALTESSRTKDWPWSNLHAI
ncbi:hypothetical protein Q8W13_18575 [Photobacterium damselae subsp. piscicida]|nr:hypothetical protein [Photobacterium damselae subsp. piscicida]MDP2545515.1 hypothetical protein [Photobacterium damselae subsp. piscicida]MDP2570015.1 hypothetical protein [Photobacterium damselae subsp. piscicida]